MFLDPAPLPPQVLSTVLAGRHPVSKLFYEKKKKKERKKIYMCISNDSYLEYSGVIHSHALFSNSSLAWSKWRGTAMTWWDTVLHLCCHQYMQWPMEGLLVSMFNRYVYMIEYVLLVFIINLKQKMMLSIYSCVFVLQVESLPSWLHLLLVWVGKLQQPNEAPRWRRSLKKAKGKYQGWYFEVFCRM